MDISCSRKVCSSCLMVDPSPIEVVNRRGGGSTMSLLPIVSFAQTPTPRSTTRTLPRRVRPFPSRDAPYIPHLVCGKTSGVACPYCARYQSSFASS